MLRARPGRRASTVVGALVVAVVLAWAATAGTPNPVTDGPPAAPAGSAATEVAERVVDDGPEVEVPAESDAVQADANRAVGILAVVLIAFALVGAVLVGRLLRRARAGSSGPDRVPVAPALGAPGTVDEALDAGSAALDDGPPGEAVIECWVRLERWASSAGVERAPAETAGELTVRVLAGSAVPREPLERLLGWYRLARFSERVLGEPERAAARADLTEILDARRGSLV